MAADARRAYVDQLFMYGVDGSGFPMVGPLAYEDLELAERLEAGEPVVVAVGSLPDGAAEGLDPEGFVRVGSDGSLTELGDVEVCEDMPSDERERRWRARCEQWKSWWLSTGRFDVGGTGVDAETFLEQRIAATEHPIEQLNLTACLEDLRRAAGQSSEEPDQSRI
jgi:hypothetical protein